MGRLSLCVWGVLVAAIPAGTLSLGSNADELEPQHQGERSTLSRTGPRRHVGSDDKEGRRTPRELFGVGDTTVKWILSARSRSGEAAAERDYLNGLVQTSAASTGDQEGNIAFVKTHKTGSTSMAAILYRYAVRHSLKLARFGRTTVINLHRLADQVRNGKFERVDIMHYHISGKGHLKREWSEAREDYRGVMSDPDSINFITVMREPRSHFLSYYYYYLQPVNQLSLKDFLTKNRGRPDHLRLLHNPLSAEFGATTRPQVEQLIQDHLSSFKLIFLTDRFDEGLMVLRRLLGWSMIDVTYMTLNETKAGAKRWDGKPFVDRPSFEDLPEEVQNEIDEFTELDQLLYAAAKEQYAKRLEPVANVIQADLAAFNELQGVVSEYLDANASSEANAMYRAEDVYIGAPPLNLF